jgi:hypothetical protein
MTQRQMTRIFPLLLLIPLLTSCGFFRKKEEPPEVIIRTVPVPIEIYQPPRPIELSLSEVRWFVITSENYEEKIKEIAELQGGSAVIFGMTPQSYENLTYNVQELRRYLRQQNKLLDYYYKYTQPSRDAAEQQENN